MKRIVPEYVHLPYLFVFDTIPKIALFNFYALIKSAVFACFPRYFKFGHDILSADCYEFEVAVHFIDDGHGKPQTFTPMTFTKLIIGLTGGIGSGKSAATDWFVRQGITVVDADVVVHELMQANSPLLQQLAKAFGDWVMDADGEMNRRAVREYVFTHDDALLKLESITHPAIRCEIIERLQQAQSDYVILSAPLLLESADAGLASLCDRILVIDVSEDIQRQRASKRDGDTPERINAIMANQLSRQQRLSYADDVINNEGDLASLYTQLEVLHDRYKAMAI